MNPKKWMHCFWIGIFLGLLFAVPVRADLYWESIQKSQGVPGTPDGSQAVKNFMTANASRYETQGDITIFDLEKMRMFTLDPNAKTYEEVDLSKMGQMPEMEGEAGKQLMGMMKGFMNTIKVTPTQETRKISGFSCTRYNVSLMGTQSEYWVTRDIPGYQEMMAHAKRFSQAMEKNPMMKQMNITAMMKDLDGFPVETTLNMMKGKITTTLQKIEQKRLSPDLFKVPPGFKKTE